MEIRPDRFKAVAGKTLGKIHRYTLIPNIPHSIVIFPFFTRFLNIVLSEEHRSSSCCGLSILPLLNSNSLVEGKFVLCRFELEQATVKQQTSCRQKSSLAQRTEQLKMLNEGESGYKMLVMEKIFGCHFVVSLFFDMKTSQPLQVESKPEVQN